MPSGAYRSLVHHGFLRSNTRSCTHHASQTNCAASPPTLPFHISFAHGHVRTTESEVKPTTAATHSATARVGRGTELMSEADVASSACALVTAAPVELTTAQRNAMAARG